jgi:uncharacterized coiled-coil protein SlyX
MHNPKNEANLQIAEAAISTNGVGILDNADQISTLMSETATNADSIANINSATLINTAGINGLEHDLDSLEGQVATNEAAISEINSAISANTALIAENTEGISTISDTYVPALVSSININAGNIGENDAAISTNTANIETNYQAIMVNKVDISTEISTARDNEAALALGVTAAQTSADENTESIDALWQEFEALRDIVYQWTTTTSSTSEPPTSAAPLDDFVAQTGQCDGAVYCTLSSVYWCSQGAQYLGLSETTASLISKSNKVSGCFTTNAGGLNFNDQTTSVEHNDNNGKVVVCAPCNRRRRLR